MKLVAEVQRELEIVIPERLAHRVNIWKQRFRLLGGQLLGQFGCDRSARARDARACGSYREALFWSSNPAFGLREIAGRHSQNCSNRQRAQRQQAKERGRPEGANASAKPVCLDGHLALPEIDFRGGSLNGGLSAQFGE